MSQALKAEGIVHHMDCTGKAYIRARKRGPRNDMELAQWLLDAKSSKRAAKRGGWYQEVILDIKSLGSLYLLLVGNRKL